MTDAELARRERYGTELAGTGYPNERVSLIDLLDRERQALRRVEDGTVTDEQAERLGYTLMRLEERMNELLDEFGLEPEDLNIDLGPPGPLLDSR